MKRFIFRTLDQYTLKTFGRKEWEAGVQHGIVCEQERIIKLIGSHNPGCLCTFVAVCYPHRLIALIKGENK